MSLYTIQWTESWLRTITADIDEDTMRDVLDVPIGPISIDVLTEYLTDNCDEGYEFHPNTTPGLDYSDEFYGITIDDVDAPKAAS